VANSQALTLPRGTIAKALSLGSAASEAHPMGPEIRLFGAHLLPDGHPSNNLSMLISPA